MKRKTSLVLSLVLLILCGLATAAYHAIYIMPDDTTPPVISVAPEIMDVSVNADEAVILQGVTAIDNKDGDVTSSIVIENVSKLAAGNNATVTYVAFDSAGNLTRAQRTLHYVDYISPVYSQTSALVYPVNSSPDVLAAMKAYDQVDGDLSARIKGTLVSAVASLNYPGVHDVEFRVTNSMGDTVYLTLPVEVYDTTSYNASVQLSQYLVYLKVGTPFNPASYLQNLTIGKSTYSLTNQNPPISNLSQEEIQALGSNRAVEVRTYINRYVNPLDNIDPYVDIINVEMKNEVNVNVPGVYSVMYTVEYEGRYIGYTRLNVIVEE